MESGGPMYRGELQQNKNIAKGEIMKQLLGIVSAVLVFCAIGCKKDNGPTGPANPNPAGVTFTIETQPGQNNGTLFAAKPNMDVRVANIIFTLSANHFADTLVNQ